MSLFAIADLHLSLGTDKPMDIFGGWVMRRNASLPLTRNPSTRFGRSAMPHAARQRSSKASGRRLPK